ncbi:F510_1955 family glycosylhydrolase [uncultured Microbacterium sp.]|uniref:F510_1955 family glycosylhydrolase n=1 Tax=uncultured Microbacterium sp. TaxID=191216 RepID=UPI0026031DC9|nr:hypothetical protein [uncultured Microbacterium sp.]
MHFRNRIVLGAAGALATAVTLVGCAATPDTPTEQPSGLPAHVHAVVVAPASDQLLLGTHEGVYPVSSTGELGDQIGDTGFDAMGLTATSQALIASGHPGPQTPSNLPGPNLGIIRSSDGGLSWEPVAFTGEKDFHALAAGADDTVYGIATDGSDVLRSDDGGTSWAPTGARLEDTAGIAVDTTGRVVAATPAGLQLSTDRAVSFAAWPDAPLLYTVGASPDRETLVGVATDGRVWLLTADEDQWRESGMVEGQVQAVGIAADGMIVVVDEDSIVMLPPGAAGAP